MGTAARASRATTTLPSSPRAPSLLRVVASMATVVALGFLPSLCVQHQHYAAIVYTTYVQITLLVLFVRLDFAQRTTRHSTLPSLIETELQLSDAGKRHTAVCALSRALHYHYSPTSGGFHVSIPTRF